MGLYIVIILLCLIFSAFFSGMEIAFNTSNKLKIEVDKSKYSNVASKISFFVENPSNFIVMILLGNNICLVIYGMFAEKLLTPELKAILPTFFSNDFVIFLIQTILATLVVLVFAEFMPKIIFKSRSNKLLFYFAIPITLLYYLLFPLVWFFNKIASLIVKPYNSNNKQVYFTPADIDYLIQEFSHYDNKNEDVEMQMVQNVIDLKNVKVRECLRPRNEVIAADINETIDEVIKKFVETGFSKILVYDEAIDNVTGYVHAFDFLKRPPTVKEIIRPIIISTETTPADKLLRYLIEKKQSIALVVDEFGGTSGIVTLEDLMEEIFGEIEDEFDKEDFVEIMKDNNTYIFSARMEIDYINETYKLSLPIDDDYETIGGLITHYHENIPVKGEIITINDCFEFRILQVSNTKIEKVMLVVTN